MTIYQSGTLNPNAMYAPGLYVQITAPQTTYVQGVAANVLGYVGVASWGPTNSPVLSGSSTDASRTLGTQTVRKRDLATAVAIALTIGVTSIQTVRVTDGTDTAAQAKIVDTAGATGVSLAALYTGSVGNSLTAAMTAGSKSGTYKLTVNRPGFTPEIFDNIAGTGVALWTALANAVNSGISDQRGPSDLVIATAGTSTALPNTTATAAFSGGTDGADGVTDAMQVGVDGDGTTRTGMYALRGASAMTAALLDHTDYTAWSTIAAFGQSEGIFFGEAGATGLSYTTVAANLASAGADNYALKVMTGDWVYWYDAVNGSQRLLSPATFWAAKRASLNPNESTLNKQIPGIVGTLRSVAKSPYSKAELAAIAQARLDFIGNPSAGGKYYGCQTDRNTSSDANRNSEAYTTMTHYLALSFEGAFGYAIGRVQTEDLRKQVRDSIQAFLSNLWTDGWIGNVNDPTKPPFQVTLDKTNNSDASVALGVMQAYVKVKYLAIVREFLITLEGGQSVSVEVS